MGCDIAMIKIISGGQTGVDRAALDAALELNVACGGWCPKGRLAEDGVIAAHYPLQEMAQASYSQRTRRNVLDSDASLVIYDDELEGGTKETVNYCYSHDKLCCLIDLAELTPDQAVTRITAFISKYEIGVLNVAGPRASKQPAIYARARQIMNEVLLLLMGK